MNFSAINTIILSGGGMHGISYIGFFKALTTKLNLNQILS